MSNFKSHFVFTRSQQSGIFVLIALIIILQLIYFFHPFSSEREVDETQDKLVEEIQQQIDSLKKVASKEQAPKIAFFNPNYISDYKAYLLGMSVAETERLHQFRKSGKWINSAEDFQKVTEVSDSLLKEIAPLFRFPDFVAKKAAKQEVSKQVFSSPLTKADLNTATAEDLQKVNGIGEKLSDRIVKYRTTLGGFRGEIQLKDVYGLSPEVIERVQQRFEVMETSEKKSLRSITVVELSELPYFNYELARATVKHLAANPGISSFTELADIKDFPVEKIDRIQLYLTID